MKTLLKELEKNSNDIIDLDFSDELYSCPKEKRYEVKFETNEYEKPFVNPIIPDLWGKTNEIKVTYQDLLMPFFDKLINKPFTSKPYRDIINYIIESNVDNYLSSEKLPNIYNVLSTLITDEIKNKDILFKLYEEIDKSKYILKLEDNFDDNGSPSYNYETWVRATNFTEKFMKFLIIDNSKKDIEIPHIYHGPEGTIDILLKNENLRLLINIPINQEQPATFYGDDFKLRKLKGSFDTNDSDFSYLLYFF